MPDSDEQLSKELFLAVIGPLRDQVSELVTHQRTLNGRVARAETKLAILDDRSPTRIGLVAGSTVAAMAAGVAGVLKVLSTLP